MDKTKRACELIFKMEGDTREDIIHGLSNFLYQVEAGQVTTGVSAGCSSSWCYSFTQNSAPTNEQYFADLRAYLDNLKEVKANV